MADKIRKIPNISDRDLINYLQKLFKCYGLNSCKSAYEAIMRIRELDIYIPEGLDEECQILYERTALRHNILNMKYDSTLAQSVLEMAGEDGRCYFLAVDVTLTGIDSLMICAGSVNESNSDLSTDLAYTVGSWSINGCPNFVIGGCNDKKTEASVHIVAASIRALLCTTRTTSKQSE